MHFLKPEDLRVGALVRRYPVTVAVTAIVTTVGLSTQDNSRAQMDRLMARYGMTWPGVVHLRFWTMPVSTVLQSDPGFPWIILFFVLTSLFALETLGGSLAAAATFLLADWISAPLTEVVLRMLALLGNHEARDLLTTGATGSSAAFHGAFAAAAMLLSRRWAGRMISLMVVVVIFQFVFERLDDAIAHAIATLVGVILAHFVWHPWLERSARPAGHPRQAVS